MRGGQGEGPGDGGSKARLPHRQGARRTTAWALLTLGVVLLAFGLSYYLYSLVARAGLKGLEVEVPRLAASTVFPTPSGSVEPETTPSVDLNALARAWSPALNALYPGARLQPKDWDTPTWAEPLPEDYLAFLEGFQPLLPGEEGGGRSLPVARRIQVPIIGVDSEVKELAILDLGDARAYETPKRVVGHIPETADPGEQGRGWYFGHIQSPILGEGSVFRNLPQISGFLREGDPVYVILSTGGGVSYLYEVFKTEVVPQKEIWLEPSEEPLVTLVTCVPEYVYDHRLLVTGRLVGVKP